MIAQNEAMQTWLEAITFQMCNMNYSEISSNLAGQLSFLKMACTKVSGVVSNDSMMIFGGRALTKTGMGRHIQHHYQTDRFDAILGGAEDVLGDLGVRQAYVFNLFLSRSVTNISPVAAYFTVSRRCLRTSDCSVLVSLLAPLIILDRLFLFVHRVNCASGMVVRLQPFLSIECVIYPTLSKDSIASMPFHITISLLPRVDLLSTNHHDPALCSQKPHDCMIM